MMSLNVYIYINVKRFMTNYESTILLFFLQLLPWFEHLFHFFNVYKNIFQITKKGDINVYSIPIGILFE